MKITVSIDMSEMMDDNGTTISGWIEDIIKCDIQRQLKKSEEYKLWIKRKTEDAINSIKGEIA